MAGTFVARHLQPTHCAGCGAARVTHDYTTHACPEEYRPSTLERAEAELAAARASGDTSRVFTARGEVQRLGGDPDAECAGDRSHQHHSHDEDEEVAHAT